MINSSRRSSKSKNCKRSSKSKHSSTLNITKTLLQKAFKNKGRGVYANEIIRILSYEIISRNTGIEVVLAMLLPKEISSIMITLFRSWYDYEHFKRNTERYILDNAILPVTHKIYKIPFKINFSTIESCIVLLSKLIISLAIVTHQPLKYIKKLRKDLQI
jgi:hypothetical protein